MENDRTIQLLEEIREIQRQVVEHQKKALENQEASIRMQREAQASAERRLRYVPILIVMVLIMAVVVMGTIIVRLTLGP